MKHIGFTGASGLMGHGIARNLLAEGCALSLAMHRNRAGVAEQQNVPTLVTAQEKPAWAQIAPRAYSR